MSLIKRGERVYFGKRSGRVAGHTICQGVGHAEVPEPYYIVQLDPESAAYLETKDNQPHDCFISLMLVHAQNLDTEKTYVRSG